MSLLIVLQSPLFPPIAIGLFAFTFVLLRPPRRGKVIDIDEDSRLSDDEVKRLIDQAIDAKRRKDLTRAGWFYEQGKLWVKAAECYQSAGNELWAAELFRKGGDHRRSGEIYRLNGYALEAASTLEQGGLLGDAGVNYAVAGDLPRAARLFEQSGRPEEAAEIYFRLGMFHQAGKLFELAKDRSRAADAYERMIETLGRKTLEADVQIAKILEKEGRQAATIRFLEAVGEVMAALRTAIRFSHDDEALRLYQDYREILAAPLLKGAKAGKLSATVLADLFERAGDHVPAARMARVLGQWRRVAELYEKAGKDEKAAAAWEEAGEIREAALSFERAGHHRRAAELFEERGEPVRAIHCYRQADLHYEAGILYERVGEPENALTSYQRVESADPNWRESQLRLAVLFSLRGRSELALDTYLDVLSREEPTQSDVDSLVAMARLLRDHGRYGEAAACFSTATRLDASQPGLEGAMQEARSRAADSGQDVPLGYPFQPSATPSRPADSLESAVSEESVAVGGVSRDDVAPPPSVGSLPAGVTAHPLPHREVADEMGVDSMEAEQEAWDADESSLVPKDTLVSFEAFIDGFSDESLADPDTSAEIDPTSAAEQPLTQADIDSPPAWDAGDDAWDIEDDTGADEWATPGPVQAAGAGKRPEFDSSFDDDQEWSGAFDDPASAVDEAPSSSSATSLSTGGGIDDAFVSGVLDSVEFGTEAAPAGSPLASFDVFGVFEKKERFFVEQFLSFQEVGAGEDVLQGDEQDDGLVLLVAGEVDIRTDGGAPQHAEALALLGPELLLKGELPDIRIIATTPVQCWVLSRGAARRLAESDRDVALRLARALRSV